MSPLQKLFRWFRGMNHMLKVDGHVSMSQSIIATLFNILGLLLN